MAEVDLFAVQVFITVETCASASRFQEQMQRALAQCEQRRRDLGGSTHIPALAVFPENVASFLALSSLGAFARRLPSINAAVAALLVRHPRRFAEALGRVGLRGGPKAAALHVVAPEAREIYESTFAALARESGMTIIAGSALLPERDGRVYNQSLTFGPDGRILGRTRKVNLVPELEDRIGLSSGRATDLHPIDTPAGHVGTLICYDGFAVPHTRREPGWRSVGEIQAERGARIIAQPSANPWAWDAPWIHRAEGSGMLRREQWRCEGLETLLPALAGVRYAVTAHLVGQVLDQRFEGRSAIYERREDGRVVVLGEAARANLAPESEGIVHARVPAPWLA